MKLRIASVAIALALAPSISLAAGGCNWKEQQAQSCVAGTSYDAATGTCVTDPATS